VRTLVAGGAGFVGSHLCRRLLDDGHEVTCVDNLLTGDVRNIEDLVDRDGFRSIEVDVVDTPLVAVDAIFHLASPASPVDYDRLPLETLAVNSQGTWRLLEVAAEAGASLLYVSTSEVYGDPLVHPQPESYWGNVDPVGPRACYDEAKRFGEALVSSWRRVHGTRAAIVRVFNTYGPNMRMDDGRVIPELLSTALDGRPMPIHGDGTQTRSFMYVDDLVEGLVTVGLDPDLDGLVMNLGNPHEVTMAELAGRIATILGGSRPTVNIPARPGDPQRRRPDISLAEARYGWRPRVDLDTGLRRTISWFESAKGPTETASTDSAHRVAVG
jgi:nucleoside-diphosphate-sugar epimerase